MTNKNTTKRALLSSTIALFLCFVMLIGTTFAWFTDEVSNTGNKITAGTLDVDLYHHNNGVRTEITNSSAPLFGEGSLAQNDASETLWEPGKTQTVFLSIKNNGSLDLKYQVAIVVSNITKNMNDVVSYIITPDAQYGDTLNLDWNNGTRVNSGINVDAEDVALTAGAEHFFALSVHMDELAGNEYQGGSITFDIKVLAAQLASEEDSFDNQYDADATYPEIVGGLATIDPGASAYELEVYPENDTSNKIGSAVVPAGAVDEDATEVGLNIVKTEYNGNITVGNDQEMVSYDVTVTGLKSDNDVPVKVEIRLPAGLDPATVKVYHYDNLIDSSYNPNTGFVTFETKSFSPFSIVYDAESEYEAPAVDENTDKPTANVTYAEEYVGAGKITWGNYGQWSPTEGLDANLEAAFVFACPENLDPDVEEAFEYWYCDFYVSLNRDLGENQIFLGGNYGSFGWVGFHNGDLTLEANTEIGLLESVTTNPWTYADVRDFVGTFTCGVGDVNNALEGATFTVKLRLTNPENAEEYYDVNVVTYTFGGNYTIQ